MQNTLIIFGGRSTEHEVSVRSARNILAALNTKLFKPILVIISRSGTWNWINGNSIPENLIEVNNKLQGADLCTLMRKDNETMLITENGKSMKIDIAFPVLHGPMGEDGTIQGMFEMMLIPYTGPGVLASAIGMDKDVIKQKFKHFNVPTVPSITLWHDEDIPSFKDVCATLKSDSVFVKSACMGSSVGVDKATTEAEYQNAVNQSFKYSLKILIEKSIKGRELECSVLGNRNPKASCVGEIKPNNHAFYSYEAKYLDPNGADIIIPAENISEAIIDEVRALAVKAFKAAECTGMARVDFFLSDEGAIYVNELNTIPGFTSISMYPKMWEASGIAYSDLITKLLELGKEEFIRKQKLTLTPDELTNSLTY
jgi:D-alanine-D-alanine ligase